MGCPGYTRRGQFQKGWSPPGPKVNGREALNIRGPREFQEGWPGSHYYIEEVTGKVEAVNRVVAALNK